MNRRRFEHLFVELSVAADELAPRFALWLRLQDLGLDPANLSRRDVLRFHDAHLERFLAEHDLYIGRRQARTLRKQLLRFDPDHPTPEEILERIFSAAN